MGSAIDMPAINPYIDMSFGKGRTMRSEMSFMEFAKAIVTDIHFLIPVAVLLIGIGVLIELH